MDQNPTDPGRQRRLSRLAARRDVERPASVDPAQGRALRARAAAEDRDGIFRARLEAVRRDVQRRDRHARWARAARMVGLLLVLLLVVLVLASAVDWPVALAVGVCLGVAVEIGSRLAARFARQRGAVAWDWQRGRHVLMGKPAEDVQKADAPDQSGRDW